MKKDYLEIAKIINTHGVRGAVKLEPWCDHPDLLKRIKRLYLEDGSSFAVAGVKSLNGGYLVAELSGIDTVEKAIPLKNRVLLAKREDIPVPKGAHFICDLIGLPVIDAETNRQYGTLEDVIQNTVQELYAVKTPDGSTVLLPAVPAFIQKIDEEAGIFVTPIDGFFH